jgi:hypothetical protein
LKAKPGYAIPGERVKYLARVAVPAGGPDSVQALIERRAHGKWVAYGKVRTIQTNEQATIRKRFKFGTATKFRLRVLEGSTYLPDTSPTVTVRPK